MSEAMNPDSFNPTMTRRRSGSSASNFERDGEGSFAHPHTVIGGGGGNRQETPASIHEEATAQLRYRLIEACYHAMSEWILPVIRRHPENLNASLLPIEHVTQYPEGEEWLCGFYVKPVTYFDSRMLQSCQLALAQHAAVSSNVAYLVDVLDGSPKYQFLFTSDLAIQLYMVLFTSKGEPHPNDDDEEGGLQRRHRLQSRLGFCSTAAILLIMALIGVLFLFTTEVLAPVLETSGPNQDQDAVASKGRTDFVMDSYWFEMINHPLRSLAHSVDEHQDSTHQASYPSPTLPRPL